MNILEINFKLYSISQVSKLLKIGRSTVISYINAGQLGVVPPPPGGKYAKIPHAELERFISQEVIREKRYSLTNRASNPDVNAFINRESTKRDLKNIDSPGIFNKIMEQANGQCIQ